MLPRRERIGHGIVKYAAIAPEPRHTEASRTNPMHSHAAKNRLVCDEIYLRMRNRKYVWEGKLTAGVSAEDMGLKPLVGGVYSDIHESWTEKSKQVETGI